MSDVEQVTAACARHGEGPVWDARAGLLRWVDMHAGDVLSLRPGGEPVRRHLAELVAAVRPRRSGGLVLGVARGFALLDPGADVPGLVIEAWPDAAVRMNDGGCDPQGRFYCGSMARDGNPGRGTVWRLDPTATAAPDSSGCPGRAPLPFAAG